MEAEDDSKNESHGIVIHPRCIYPLIADCRGGVQRERL